MRRIVVTAEQGAEIHRLREQGLSLVKTARAVGLRPGTLWNFLNDPREGKLPFAWDEATFQWAYAERAKKVPWKRLAFHWPDYRPNTVRANFELECKRRGLLNPRNAKIEAHRKVAQEMRAAGQSVGEIARTLGINRSFVTQRLGDAR